MKSRLLLNLILLAVIGVLAALAFLEPGKEEPKPIRLTEIKEDSVNRIELRNKETIVFEKADGHWRITAPFAAPANEIRVRQLLNIASAESAARYPLKPEDKAKFELDKPKAILTIGSTQLVFGATELIDMRRYVQVGDTLHLVNDDFIHHLTASATDYVDKKLLPENAKPNEFFLPGLKAKQEADGKWSFDPNPGDAAAGMTELVNAWQSSRAIDVKRIDHPPQGDIIRIGFADHPPVEFIIVQREPELVLARPDLGLQFQVAAESVKPLLILQKPGAEASSDNPDAEDESANPNPEEEESSPPGSETEGTEEEGESVEKENQE